jgi:hypothetical protein
MYESGRYLTVTGQQYQNLHERLNTARRRSKRYITGVYGSTEPRGSEKNLRLELNDSDLLKKAIAAERH